MKINTKDYNNQAAINFLNEKLNNTSYFCRTGKRSISFFCRYQNSKAGYSVTPKEVSNTLRMVTGKELMETLISEFGFAA